MCEEHGDVRLRGRYGENLTAGRIEICNGTNWRSVCSDYWGRPDAKVVCRQLGFHGGGNSFTDQGSYLEHIVMCVLL